MVVSSSVLGDKGSPLLKSCLPSPTGMVSGDGEASGLFVDSSGSSTEVEACSAELFVVEVSGLVLLVPLLDSGEFDLPSAALARL